MDERPTTRSSDMGLLDTVHEKGPRQLPEETNLDEAFKFIQLVNANLAYQPPDVVKLKKIGVKVDIVILPMLFSICLLQWLILYACQHMTSMGVLGDLSIDTSDYAEIITAENVTFLAGTVFSGIVLVKIRPATWLATNIILCGIATACVAATQSYITLLIARAIAGLLKGSTIPCLTLLTSQWYHKKEQPLRFCLWGCGMAVGQIAGPLLCYGFQHIQSTYFSRWRALYLVLGCCNVVIGLAILLMRMNDPTTAAGHWMTHQETATLLQYVSTNRTTIRNTRYSPSHVKATVKDVQVYLLTLLVLSVSIAGAISQEVTFKSFEYLDPNNLQQAALRAAPGTFTLVVTLFTGFLLQYIHVYRSIPLGCLLLSICSGAGIVVLANSQGSTHTEEVPTLAYVAASLTDLTNPAILLILSYAVANIAGATKRAISICIISCGFPIGLLITSMVTPDYLSLSQHPYPSTSLCFGGSIVAVVSLLLLVGWYVLANRGKQRYRELSEQRELEDGIAIVKNQGDEWRDRTDQADMDFVYRF